MVADCMEEEDEGATGRRAVRILRTPLVAPPEAASRVSTGGGEEMGGQEGVESTLGAAAEAGSLRQEVTASERFDWIELMLEAVEFAGETIRRGEFELQPPPPPCPPRSTARPRDCPPLAKPASLSFARARSASRSVVVLRVAEEDLE
jgi:hypothetical protein